MKSMFQVRTKEIRVNENGDLVQPVYKVHNVRDDGNGYPQFLIFEDGQWGYKSAKYFKPVEENDYEKY